MEISQAIVSVCMPSDFHLIQREFYHGMPALFSTADPSQTYGLGNLGSISIVSEAWWMATLGTFQRLNDSGLRVSQQGIVSTRTASRALETVSEDVPLQDALRSRVEVKVSETVGICSIKNDPERVGW